MSSPIYFEIFELMHQYLYGIDTVLTGEMQLTLTQISTILSLLVVLLPFIIVFMILRAVFGR